MSYQKLAPRRLGTTGYILRHLFLTTLAGPLGCASGPGDAEARQTALPYELLSDDWHTAVFIPGRQLVLLEQSIASARSSVLRHTIASVVRLDIVTFDFSRPGSPVTCEAVLAAPWRSRTGTWTGRLLWVGTDGTIAAVPDDRCQMTGEATHAFRFDQTAIGTPSDLPFIYAEDRNDGIARATAIVAAASQGSF